MTIPSYQEYMKPILSFLSDKKEHTVKEIDEHIAFVFNLLSVPYNALIIAHERMSVFAYVSVLDSLLRLLVAIVLPYILLDKLILYSALICSVTVIIRIIYQLYCYYHFPECRHYTFVWNAYKGKELLAYSAWNMIGSVALISRQQGINIVVNLFFGPLLNAAHSIGQQLNGAVSQFINNIYVATRPQITKLYAVGNTLDMWRLVFSSSKLAFYLLMLITIPALIELEVVLKLWLHEVPAYTVAIARLMIVSILVETLVNQVIGAYQAANRIRKYQLYSSTIILLNIPVAYVLLKLNIGDQLTPYWVSVILSVLYVSAILWVAKKEIGLDLKAYLTEVLIVDVRVYVLTGVIVAMSVWNIAPSCYRLFLTVALTLLISCIVIWFVGLKPSEKSIIQDIVKRKILRK